MNIKNTIKRLAHRFGYDIRRLDEISNLRSTIAESYLLIHSLGFRPVTIVDVGVASGTPELYAAFPESYFLLIEPLREFEPNLITILKQYRGSYVLAGAGPATREATLNVHPKHLAGSSLFRETMGPEADGYETTVPIIKIDDIVSEKGVGGPFLIKVDVQGAEIDVLEGCREALRYTEVVVLEVSMFHLMKGAPEFHEVIVYMKERGFVAYDIILGWNRPLDNALAQIDLVFVKEYGQFRHNHSTATVEYMKQIGCL